MTWVLFWNYVFFQWLGIRLARWGLTEEQIEGEPFNQKGWAFVIGVLPLTGWSNGPYIGPAKVVGPFLKRKI